MPRLDYKTCRACGRHTSEVGLLSHTRLCNGCAHRRFRANAIQISLGAGPWHDYRRAQIAASVGAVILDDVKPNP